jgi:putative SOS response-associated peptidase YedK
MTNVYFTFMCFYNGIDVNRAQHIRLKRIEKEIGNFRKELHRPLQSGFAYGSWPVLRPTADGQDADLVLMHWELVPFYVHTRADWEHFRHGGINPKTGKKDPPRNTLNAIGEEMLDKVSYKQAALKRRCLVLSSGFYEWRHFTPAGTRKDQAYPYYITLPDREYFFMGGIWQPWTDRETGEVIETFAIVTTAANQLMASVHNKKKRMPLLLDEDHAMRWIDPALSEAGVRELAHFKFPSSEMQPQTIRKDFRESVNPTEPFEYPDLPPLDF